MQSTQQWRDVSYIAFDIETTGAYPISDELCEIAMVKWQNNQIIDEYQTLLKPKQRMTDFIIGIHGITNEMVADAPVIGEKIQEIYEFIGQGIPIAHHAPFDMGFLSYEFEQAKIDLPQNQVVCSSLLSRQVFPESENHKLQTLVEFFNLEKGTAHRALYDSKACLQVALKCMEKLGADKTLDEVFSKQGGALEWNRFSMLALLERKPLAVLFRAIQEKQDVELKYEAGSRPGKSRRVTPIGMVRNPQGDYLVGRENHNPEHKKRFYLDKISYCQLVG